MCEPLVVNFNVPSNLEARISALLVLLGLIHCRYWDPGMEEQKQMPQKPKLWLALLKYFNWKYLHFGIIFFITVSSSEIFACIVGPE